MQKRKGGRVCAVCELGTDRITMQVAQNKNGRVAVLDRLECFFDLEKEIQSTGLISGRSVAAISDILAGFLRVMRDYGVESSRAFGTSFLRHAENCSFVLGQLAVRTGMQIEIISDDEEKTLLYWQMHKAMNDIEHDGERYLCVVPGTDSVGLALQSSKRQRSRQNLPVTQFDIVSMRMQIADDTDDISAVMAEYLNVVTEGVVPFGLTKQVKSLVVADSEIESIARACGVTLSHGACTIKAGSLSKAARAIMPQTPETAEQTLSLSAKSAKNVYASILLYDQLAALCKVDTVVGLYGGLTAAVLEQMLIKPQRQVYESFVRENALGCARTQAKKCGCSMEHVELVARFAGEMFDKLRRHHGLDSRARLKLQLAALLHNCGYFVDLQHHAACSDRFISTFSVSGLDDEETRWVAAIQSGAPSEDLAVMRLRAIFQLADALDASKRQKLQELNLRIDPEKFVITTICDENLYLEQRAFAQAAALFQKVYGLQPVLNVKSGLL